MDVVIWGCMMNGCCDMRMYDEWMLWYEPDVRQAEANAYTTIHPSIHPSTHLLIHPSFHSSIHLSIHSSIQPSTEPSFHPSIYSSTHPSIYLGLARRIDPRHSPSPQWPSLWVRDQSIDRSVELGVVSVCTEGSVKWVKVMLHDYHVPVGCMCAQLGDHGVIVHRDGATLEHSWSH